MKPSFNDFWQTVPQYNLSGEDKSFIAQKLVEKNKILRSWYSYVPRRKTKFFRDHILNGKFSVILHFIPKELHATFLDDCQEIIKTRKEKLQRFDNKTLEEVIVAGYNKLLLKMVSDFRRKSIYSMCNDLIFDMYQDSYIKLIDAIYSYTNEEICFSTFACVILKNHLYTMTDNKYMVKIPYHEKQLLKKYKKMVKKSYLDQNELLNIEEYIQRLELDNKEVNKLQKAITRQKPSKNIEEFSDFESCQFVVSNNTLDFDCQDFDIKEKISVGIKKADLTTKERMVLEYALNTQMKYGWQSQLAKEMNITKMRVSQLVKTAFGKIKNYILSNKQTHCGVV